MTCLIDRVLSGAGMKSHTSMLGMFFINTLAICMPISKKKSLQRFLEKTPKFFIVVRLIIECLNFLGRLCTYTRFFNVTLFWFVCMLQNISKKYCTYPSAYTRPWSPIFINGFAMSLFHAKVTVCLEIQQGKNKQSLIVIGDIYLIYVLLL